MAEMEGQELERPGHAADASARPKKPNPSRGSSQYSSGAPFAERFREWWDTQNAFSRLEDLAAAIGVSQVTLRFWLAARGFPRDPQCDRLYWITNLRCFGPGRDAARADHERLVPRQVKKKRRDAFRALSPEVRSRLGRSARARRHKFVCEAELAECRVDPRKAKTIRGRKFVVCLECGQIWRDLSGHLGIHGMTEAQYKAKFGINRGTSLRSAESGEKQGASLKSRKHRPPARSREYMAQAIKASLGVREPGRARLEERLNRRGKRLGARPDRWKHTETGEVISDARIAQLRLRGLSAEEIAGSVGMSLTPVFMRLKRMGFPRRDRVFVNGEPVTGKDLVGIVNDYHLPIKEAAERTGISEDWVRRLIRRSGREWTSVPVARAIRKLHDECLAEFRRKPSGGERGGRPKLLPPSDERKMAERYDQLRRDLKGLRTWIRAQERAPDLGTIWDWLCRCFRSGHLRAIQFSPHFFTWVVKNYDRKVFCSGDWVPRDLALEFVASELDVPGSFVPDFLSHHASELHQNGAIHADPPVS